MFQSLKKEKRNVQNDKVSINYPELKKLTKNYKKIKKYMKTPIYELLKMNKTEKIVKNLLNDDPEGNN